MSDTIDVRYWLPITTVNVTGSIVTVRGTSDRTIYRAEATPAVVTVVTRPDYGVPCRLSVARDAWTKQHAKLQFLPDARLSSAESKTEHHRWDEVTAAAKLAGVGATIGLSVGGPLGAALGGVAGAALSVAATGRLIADVDVKTQQSDAERFASLGIDRDYAEHDPAAAGLLADLRHGEARALLDFGAAASGAADAADLAGIDHRLKLIRKELVLAETTYQQWLNTRRRTTTELFDREIAINLLPTRETARDWLTASPANDPTEVTEMRTLCNRFGIVVTCDVSLPPGDAHTHRDEDETSVRYRALVPATLRTFAVRTGQSAVLELRSVDRILVAVPGQERSVPLFGGGSDRALDVSFDPSGALVSISADETGSGIGAAAAIGGLPDAFASGMTTGGTLAEPFTAAGRAKALQAKVDEKKALAALSPRADPLQELRDEVTRAELEARRSAAERATTDPTTTAVVVIGGASQDG